MLKRKATLKRVMICELILCYMAILAMISHIRAPQPYETIMKTSLLEINDFESFDGSAVIGQTMTIKNGAEEQLVGYQAPLQLVGLERIRIMFQIDCDILAEGDNLLSVDLYEAKSGYDFAEQENVLHLKEGINEISVNLPIGENAPDTAMLRLFTLDQADWTIHSFHVYEEVPEPKVTPALIITPVALLTVFGITVFVYGFILKKARRNGCEEKC